MGKINSKACFISIYNNPTDTYEKHIHQLLYKLLTERTTQQSISHTKMPTLGNHIKFIRKKPYKEWWMVYIQEHIVGSLYVTHQNEIGLFLFKKHQKKNYGSKILEKLFNLYPRTKFLANINPLNENSIKFFNKHNFTLIREDITQNTYMREPTTGARFVKTSS